MNTHPDSLQTILRPRSIAIIGASDNRNKVGGRPLHYLTRFGYGGRIFPVNPGRSEVQGVRTYPSIDALDETPDLAIVAVAGEEAQRAVMACASRGVGSAIVMSSGFGETGEAGRRDQDRLLASARSAGMRIIGPNAQGVANFELGAVANFSTMFMEVAPADGPVAIISQSGAASVMPYALLRERGIGVRYLAASGNDADVTVSELLGATIQDPEIRLVLLYVETIRDPEVLARAAEAARSRGVAIVALKSGHSARGRQAAQSHTGAMASEDAVVDRFFRRHGIWRVQDIHGLVNAAEVYLKGWKPRGQRLVVLSHSGAVGIMCADTAERVGLPLASFAPETESAIQRIVPAFGSIQNPVDLTAALMNKGEMFGPVLEAIARDAEADLVLIGIPVAGEGYDVPGLARQTAAVAQRTGTSIVVAAPQLPVLQAFSAVGVPTFSNETDAVVALHQFAAHSELLARPPLPPQSPAAPLPRFEGAGILGEAQSLSVLAEAGVSVVPHRLCRTEDEALAALAALTGPVVVKACSAQIPHKSEYGLVHLGVRTADELRQAYASCVDGMARLGVASQGVIVASMVRGRRELALGAKLDPVFGPVVMVGDGGKYIEAMRDFALLLPPFDTDAVREALDGLRVAPLLRGVRGEPPLDVDAYARAAVALGRLMAAADGRIASVDVNPLMLGAAGEGAVAVDALVELTKDEQE